MIKTVSKIKNLKGEITIPADKSVSHRAVMLSALAKGTSLIKNFSSGADCHSTLNLFKMLGVKTEFLDEKTIKIMGGKLTPNNTENIYPCGNSGTTMRLVSGILAGQEFESSLTGDESLSKRPMKRVIEPLRLMGADISSMDGKAPLYIRGKRLFGMDYSSELSSAQVKSCVLLAGINESTQGITSYEEPFKSRNHTELMLKYLGADIEIIGSKIVVKPSGLEPKEINIIGEEFSY